MNALHRIAFRLRAIRIEILRTKRAGLDRAIRELEDEQRASLGVRFIEHHAMATRTRPPVPEFLRRGRP